MNTTTKERAEEAQTAQSRGEVATFQKPRLPWNDALEERFSDIGVTKSSWKALVEAVFPSAKTVDSIAMALSYCKARNLDPFKRPVHIVPVWDSERRGYVETVWPGISELRTTAMRTGKFAGMDAAEFGEMIEEVFTGSVKRGQNWEEVNQTVEFPMWCQITVYRMIEGQRVPFVGPKVYWREAYASQGKSPIPNAMWTKRPRGQLEKCAEAAALRRAFPEELGNEYAAEEIEGQRFMGDHARDVTPAKMPRDAKSSLDAFSGVSKHGAVEAEDIDAEEEDHAGVRTDEDASDPEGEPGSDEPENEDAAIAYTQEALKEIGAFKNANAINAWFDTSFITKAKANGLTEAQIEIVTNHKNARVAELTKAPK